METLAEAKKVKSNKEHRCNFCGERILKGQHYMRSTHILGDIYSWKSHEWCHKLSYDLNMYEGNSEGVSATMFREYVDNAYIDYFIDNLSSDSSIYTEVIAQLRFVKFNHKLWHVIRRLKKQEKEE